MTFGEVYEAVLARAQEYSKEWPTSETVVYLRISQRQQELFGIASRENPDFFGRCATAPVQGTAGSTYVNLRTMGDDEEVDVWAPERVQRVEIANPGTSDYTAGDEVEIVTVRDPNAAYAPRAYLRDMVLYGVGADLDDVTTVRAFYSVTPRTVLPNAPDTPVSLPEAYQHLLVLDGARDLFRRNIELPSRDALIGMLDKEEVPLLEGFAGHVRSFAGPLVSRFDRQGGAAVP